MTSQTLFQNTFILKRPKVLIFADIIKVVTMLPCLSKQSLKTKKKFKELEIMYQNAICIYIS